MGKKEEETRAGRGGDAEDGWKGGSTPEPGKEANLEQSSGKRGPGTIPGSTCRQRFSRGKWQIAAMTVWMDGAGRKGNRSGREARETAAAAAARVGFCEAGQGCSSPSCRHTAGQQRLLRLGIAGGDGGNGTEGEHGETTRGGRGGGGGEEAAAACLGSRPQEDHVQRGGREKPPTPHYEQMRKLGDKCPPLPQAESGSPCPPPAPFLRILLLTCW